MTEYIDLDTPLEVYVGRGSFCKKQISTLRDFLDTNRIPYTVADVQMNDLISRQAAIDTIAEFLYYSNNLEGMIAGFDLADWKRKIGDVLEDTDNE